MSVTVSVENFQSVGRATVHAEGLTVIVGPSDRGKSALLRAIESALFNRAGDQFVRQGQKTASVRVELPGHVVQWEKGKGVNKFTVDGEDYSKVGTKAPPPLQALGFRDVVVGAREKDGKLEGGEVLRPQVADQFNPEFVLDRSGAFVSELLVRVSRLGVVQKAGRLCGQDLRNQKAILKTRTEDLVVAADRMARLDPIEPLRVRVIALAHQSIQLRKGLDRIDRLRDLIHQRAQLRAQMATPLPRPAPRATPDERVSRLARLQTLLEERARCQRIPALPKVRKVKKTTDQQIARWQALQPLLVDQRQARNWIQQGEQELARVQRETAKYAADLHSLKIQLKVCPVCDRPFAYARP